jgi:hypothetical protein
VDLSLTDESKRKMKEPNHGEDFHYERVMSPNDDPMKSFTTNLNRWGATTHVRVMRFQVENTTDRSPID